MLLTGQVMSYDSRQKDWTVHFPPPMCFDHNYNYIGTYLNLRQAQGAVRRWKKGRVAVASEEYWLEEVRRIGAAFEAWEFVPK